MAIIVFTIGHSTRPLEEFVELLCGHAISRLVDVRTVPRSRHNPQFNRDVLPAGLARVGIEYVHMPSLGGLRRPRRDSSNTAWRNAGFRGYADYMETPEFADALAALLAHAHDARIAIMCAEAVPWRCHRSLIADALVVRGVRVEHIVGGSRTQAHVLTRFARVDGPRVTYPDEASQQRLPGTA